MIWPYSGDFSPLPEASSLCRQQHLSWPRSEPAQSSLAEKKKNTIFLQFRFLNSFVHGQINAAVSPRELLRLYNTIPFNNSPSLHQFSCAARLHPTKAYQKLQQNKFVSSGQPQTSWNQDSIICAGCSSSEQAKSSKEKAEAVAIYEFRKWIIFTMVWCFFVTFALKGIWRRHIKLVKKNQQLHLSLTPKS